MQQPLQLVVFIIGTIIVVFGAYYVTYYVGLKASGRERSRQRNRNINMLDRFAISKDKSFCLIEIAGKIYVIGVTNQSMTLIDTLDAVEFAEAAAERHDVAVWAEMPGMQLGSRLASKLFDFVKGKINNTQDTVGDEAAGSGTFADSMKTASEKSTPGSGQEESGKKKEDR